MALIYLYQNRGSTRDIVILDANGDTVIPAENDVIRAMITRRGQTAKLTVASNAPTDAGSTFTKNSPTSGTNRLRLDASDLDFEPGTYTMLVDLLDDSDTQEWKNVDRQVVHMEAT